MNYGDELTIIKSLTGQDVMCVATDGKWLYYGSLNCLSIADLSDTCNPEKIADFFIRGECRQLAVKNGIAFITAREQALYIIDVHDPYHPALICHYDTIELATGVCVVDNLLLVAQRQYGVEIIDISQIDQPKHLCRIKTSEAQSVTAANGYMYVGDWGLRELTTIDIHEPARPFIIHQNKLGGYGDGVHVSGRYLYASTGHHAKTLPAPARETDEGYGMGHGMEIYDLTDPAVPVFVSRVQFQKLYRRVKYDMWNVSVSGNLAFCADTHNGVFVVDVTDKTQPVVLGHYQTLTGGTAIGDHCLYAACIDRGLLVFDWNSARFASQNDDAPLQVPVAHQASAGNNWRTFKPGGQVWAVSMIGEYALIAAGSAGLIVARLWPEVQVIDTIKTNDFALFVDTYGDLAILSEGNGGATLWRHQGGGQLVQIGKINAENLQTIRQAKLYANGSKAILQSQYTYVLVDLSDPSRPRQIAQDPMLIIYWDQMCTGDIKDRYTCVFDHPNGIRWIDFARSGKDMVTGVHLNQQFHLSSGLVSVNDQILAVYPGGYRLAEPMCTDLESQPLIKHGGSIVGKPLVSESWLCVSNRITAEVEIIDISDIHHPRLIDAFSTPGTPAEVFIHNQSLLIPDGYQGLHIIDDYITEHETTNIASDQGE